MTYGEFVARSSDYIAFQHLLSQWPFLVEQLVLRREHFNRHLMACAPVLAAGLTMWGRFLIEMQIKHGMTDPGFYRMVSAETKFINSVSALLTCAHCSADDRATMTSLWNVHGLQRTHSWMTKQVEERSTLINNMYSDQQRLAATLTGGGKANVSQHFDLFRDGKALLDGLREDGFLSSWVVGCSTMIFAMRYGTCDGASLPSGAEDRSGASDMDIFVRTDDWHQFAAEVAVRGVELGFDWCGWLVGWPMQSIFCLRPGVELDILAVDSGYAPSMLPSFRCAVRSRTVSTSPSSRNDVLELPCPRDPLAFMRRVWHDRLQITTCLPLPSSLEGDVHQITDEDVKFLWQHSMELHTAGFLSMAPYFARCTGHPQALLAQQLGQPLASFTA